MTRLIEPKTSPRATSGTVTYERGASVRAISSWRSSKPKLASASSSISRTSTGSRVRIAVAPAAADAASIVSWSSRASVHLERVDVLERQALEPAVDEDVDGAPVGDARHREPRDVG